MTSVSANRLFAVLSALLQLVLPVLLLTALGAAAFVYGDRPVLWLGQANAQWLTLGHLIVPLMFFAVHLTNRRYGPGYALGQVALAWLLGAALLWISLGDLAMLAGRSLPPINEVAGFASALFVAQLFCVLVFDRTRGPRWWVAPLMASLWGSVLFCALAFPLAYLGTPIDWFARLLSYVGILAVASVLLLLPYWLLRRMVPPMSGFGGY